MTPGASAARRDGRKPSGFETQREDLRIVSDRLWERAHARIATTRKVYLTRFTGRAHGRPAGNKESPYLLSGFLECAACGGSFVVGSHHGARARHFNYLCNYHRERGDTVCRNGLAAPMVETDAAVLAALERKVFHPAVIEGLVDEMLASRPTDGRQAERQRIEHELDQLAREIECYAEAIAKSGPLDSLLAKLNTREEQHRTLRRARDSFREGPAVDPRRVAARIRERLEHGRSIILARSIPDTRQLIWGVLNGSRLVLTPARTRRGWQYAFSGQAALVTLLGDVDLGPWAWGGAMVTPGVSPRGVTSKSRAKPSRNMP